MFSRRQEYGMSTKYPNGPGGSGPGTGGAGGSTGPGGGTNSPSRPKLRFLAAAMVGVALLGSAAGCSKDSDVVNKNLDTDADNFKVLRRVVFYNAILDKYIMEVEGYCSVDPGDGNRMTVTCKVGNQYKRNALGKSDNVLWWYEQLTPTGQSANHYVVIFKPESIIPQPEVR
jgi:hypothetical protein